VTVLLVDAVIEVIRSTLCLDPQVRLDARSGLLDELPELDSMAIIQLVIALEDRFDLEIDGDEITGETFESVGSLADFVRRAGAGPGDA
jgi:acyl carrier protein